MTLPTGLYGIADASFGNPLTIGQALIAAGCTMVQFRAKGWRAQRIEEEAALLVKHAHQAGAKIIINDHVDVAASVGADGVHIGQEDGSIEAARKRLGTQFLIGKSTHNLDQVMAAQDADYIGFGPIFTTNTKAGAGAAVGIDSLTNAVRLSAIPVIAIGGIARGNLQQVKQTGVHGWAVIRDLIGHEPIDKAIHHFAF